MKRITDLLDELAKNGTPNPLMAAKELGLDWEEFSAVLVNMAGRELSPGELTGVAGWGMAIGYFYALKRLGTKSA
jgi:hypothetical protein